LGAPLRDAAAGLVAGVGVRADCRADEGEGPGAKIRCHAVTTHAEEEMDADGLSIIDVESAIYNWRKGVFSG
jgi:hypothetical protein